LPTCASVASRQPVIGSVTVPDLAPIWHEFTISRLREAQTYPRLATHAHNHPRPIRMRGRQPVATIEGVSGCRSAGTAGDAPLAAEARGTSVVEPGVRT